METRQAILPFLPAHYDQWVLYLSSIPAITVLPDAWVSPEQVGMLRGTSCAMMVPPPAPIPLSEPLFI